MSADRGPSAAWFGICISAAGLIIAFLAWQYPRSAPPSDNKTAAAPPGNTSVNQSAVRSPVVDATNASTTSTGISAGPDQTSPSSSLPGDTVSPEVISKDMASLSAEVRILLRKPAPGAPPGGAIIVPSSDDDWSGEISMKRGFLYYDYVAGEGIGVNQECHRLDTASWEDCNGVGMTDASVFDLRRFRSTSQGGSRLYYSYLPTDEPSKGVYWAH